MQAQQVNATDIWAPTSQPSLDSSSTVTHLSNLSFHCKKASDRVELSYSEGDDIEERRSPTPESLSAGEGQQDLYHSSVTPFQTSSASYSTFDFHHHADEFPRRYATTTSDIRGTLDEHEHVSWGSLGGVASVASSQGLSVSLLPPETSSPPVLRRDSDSSSAFLQNSAPVVTHRPSLSGHCSNAGAKELANPGHMSKRPLSALSSFPMSPSQSDTPSLSSASSTSTRASSIGDVAPPGQNIYHSTYESPGSRFMRSQFPPTSSAPSTADLPSYQELGSSASSQGMVRADSLESPRTLLAEFSFAPSGAPLSTGFPREIAPFDPRLVGSPRIAQDGHFSHPAELQYTSPRQKEYEAPFGDEDGAYKKRKVAGIDAFVDYRRDQAASTFPAYINPFTHSTSLHQSSILHESTSHLNSPSRGAQFQLPPTSPQSGLAYTPYPPAHYPQPGVEVYQPFPRTPNQSSTSATTSQRRTPRTREESYPTDNTELIHTPPPQSEFENCSKEDLPRQQKLRLHEDHYTPLWVRRNGHAKEAWCALCDDGGKWLQLKNSAYWYHRQSQHGVSSTSGRYFAPPVETRPHESGDKTEGLCHTCNEYVPYQTHKQSGQSKGPTLWWRHAHQCHQAVSPRKGGGKKAASPKDQYSY